MKKPKCPECGETLHRRARQCRKCKTHVTVCAECGTTYKKGELICDMCGRELKRRRAKGAEVREKSFEPTDLVSVINGIKRQNVGYRLLVTVKWIGAISFMLAIPLALAVGFMTADLFSDTAVAVIKGVSIEKIVEHIISTPTRNFNMWTRFMGDITQSDASFGHFLKFSNYLISALFIPALITSLFYIGLWLPIDLLEKLVLGIAVRKKGYNEADTVIIFERPILIYNSKDSFDKAYTYFPFIGKAKGRAGSVAADLLDYGSNILSCLAAVGILSAQTLLKIIIRIVSEFVNFPSDAVITFGAVAAVLLYAGTVIGIRIAKTLLKRAIRKKQLKQWIIKE